MYLNAISYHDAGTDGAEEPRCQQQQNAKITACQRRNKNILQHNNFKCDNNTVCSHSTLHCVGQSCEKWMFEILDSKSIVFLILFQSCFLLKLHQKCHLVSGALMSPKGIIKCIQILPKSLHYCTIL